jgi:hypothetical protein
MPDPRLEGVEADRAGKLAAAGMDLGQPRRK